MVYQELLILGCICRNYLNGHRGPYIVHCLSQRAALINAIIAYAHYFVLIFDRK